MKYPVILADPPWRGYDTAHWRRKWEQGYTGSQEHFPTLTVDDIAQLPIAERVASHAALFLWTTGYLMPDAVKIMTSWGFRYAGVGFTWVKLNANSEPLLGMGQYVRNNAEYCLLGIKGKPKRQDKGVNSVILSRRRQHSRKPDEQYERIMRLFDGPYLELFARQSWPGWDTWGNQTALFPAQPYLISESQLAQVG